MKLWQYALVLVSAASLYISPAFADEDWAKSSVQWGCGMSEPLSYQNAINSYSGIAAQYRAQCNSQGGRFGWTYSKGICEPYDPNAFSCGIECPIYTTVTCTLPPLQLKVGQILPDGRHVLRPGDKAEYVVVLQNVKNKPLTNVTGDTVISRGANLVSISNTKLAWDTIGIGQSGESTSKINAQVAANAPCGSSFDLKFTLDTYLGKLEQVQNVPIGKFNGLQIIAEAPTLNAALDQTGKTFELPIAFSEATNVPSPRKVTLNFKAKVNGNTYVRFSLISPDGVTKVVSEGYANGEFEFNQDLSDAFKSAKALGSWKLLAQSWGAGTLVNYKLAVVPDSYTCQ